MDQQRIVFVAFEGFQLLDLTGPFEVFQQAARLRPGYSCETVGPAAGLVRSNSGLRVHADHGIADLDPLGIDTLVVAGGSGVDEARGDPALVAWIAAAGATARRVASVCSGVFLLAAAGLVAEHRVTSHWSRDGQLRREYPELAVDTHPIFIRDGRVWTSAGVTAGMDLALALVEDDHGREVAHAIAQELVLFLRRPGSQAQFSVPLWSAQPSTDPIRAVVSAVHADPGGPHSIGDLAARAGLSPRHLQRRFTAELGVPPAEYVERVRIEAARRALAEGDAPVATIARRCGLGSAETLRRAFHRHLGVPPSDYRDRFRSSKEHA
ncbi:GlxA family transcriptional regulator [Streptomyces netropsis]|uniref:Transcriptional regulator GlxA family with amidase domain n=1 Tax=Streptomyces netropsis TaxID=55404 RepID=A0A7W7PFQ9_STRNE|nr:GlxA family transcriptional regulator [Streptomyces netropsis]MBB4886985.1 transcriptional regulator GlxA family with amidase domain [Streptomyces netropsis]GGR24690.1 putative transcriptional regulator, AraC family protein [Streptomyces netropsis]